MDWELTPISRALAQLPWFGDLTSDHQAALLAEFAELVAADCSPDALSAFVRQAAATAHVDGKWARLELLRKARELEPPRAA